MSVLRALVFSIALLAIDSPAGAAAIASGDVDGNGAVDLRDVVLLERVLRGDVLETSLAAERRHDADVAPLVPGALPGDGRLDAADALLLLAAARGDDVDGDGLDTDAELAGQTSAFASDSDGDGAADGADAEPTSDDDGDGFGDGFDPEPQRQNALVGTVQGFVFVDSRCQPDVVRPFPYVTVRLEDAAGATLASVDADVDGRFAFSAAQLQGAVRYVARLEGTYARVTDTTEHVMAGEAAQHLASGPVVPGAAIRIVFHDANSTRTQRTAYYHTHVALAFYRSLGLAMLPTSLPRVELSLEPFHLDNVPQLFGSKIILPQPIWNVGPGYPGSVYLRTVQGLDIYELPVGFGDMIDTIYHEYGHLIDGTLRSGRAAPILGVTEAFAIVFDALVTGRSEGTEDFYPTCTFDPSVVVPSYGDLDPDAPFDATVDGSGILRYLYAGQSATILWDILEELREQLPDAEARATLARLWLAGRRMAWPTSTDEMLDSLFVADEVLFDDLSLGSDSPHEALMCEVITRATHHPGYSFCASGDTSRPPFALLTQDGDGDGYTDAAEYGLGTDPAVPQVMGTVEGTVLEVAERCGGAPVAKGLPDLHVELLGPGGALLASATTAEDGSFLQYGVTAPVSYRATLAGRVVEVGTGNGDATDPPPAPVETLTGSIDPGVPVTIRFEGGGSVPGVVARTAYLHVSRAADWVRELDPTLSGLEASLPVYVRTDPPGNPEYLQNPNRYRFPTMILFSDLHTATSPSAIQHEFGHALTDVLYDDDGEDDGPIHEGNADVFAVLRSGDSRVGLGLHADLTPPASQCRTSLYDADNDLRHPTSTDTRLLVSGVAWDLLEALRARYEPGLDDEEVREIAFRIWHEGRKKADRRIPTTFAEQVLLLLQGDEIAFGDGNPSTPPPHRTEICDAIRAHWAPPSAFACP